MKTENAVLPSGCGFCGNTGTLQRCSSCKVVSYCNRDHQAAHRGMHKSACNDIRKRRRLLEHEEQKLRDHPGDEFTAPDIFNSSEGIFWKVLETRDYMQARFAFVTDLQQVDTQVSVQSQVDHLMDMLRLCRSDNMGVRDMVPTAMLRLNKDQECYDFIKWWATTGKLPDYDWGDQSLPYLDVKNADAFESVGYLCPGDSSELHHLVAATLLKIKLLLDLNALQDPSTVTENTARRIVGDVRDSLPRSPIVTGNKEIMERTDHTTAIYTLRNQVDALYRAVNKANKHFWQGLQHPREHLMSQMPGMYSPGSKEQMQLALLYSYDAWLETPGAMEFIRSMP